MADAQRQAPGSVLCFYHHPCNDGSASAAALQYRLERAGLVHGADGLRLCPYAYTSDWDEPMPETLLRDIVIPSAPVAEIYMVDITFSKVKFDQIVEYLRSIDKLAGERPRMICIDHHRTALEKVDELEAFCDETMIRIGPGLSGSTLVWTYFNQKLGEDFPTPTMLQYIADQDLWEWEMPDSREINASLNVLEGQTERVYRELIESLVDEERWKQRHLMQGRAILEMVDAQVRKSSWQVADVPYEETTLRLLNSAAFTSELGNSLCSESPDAPNSIAVIYSIQRDWSVRCSIRSIDGGKLSARGFAERFGGGGHDNAAGCRFDDFDAMLSAFGIRR